MKYKVGEKVIIRPWEDMAQQFGLDFAGDICTYCCFAKSMRKYCGKEMTIRDITAGGNYVMENGEGYIFSEDTFEKKHSQKIVITSDGSETLARLYDGKKVIKTATAKCAPDDTFDFAIGAKIAYERLMRETKPEEKKEPKYFNGKVVCIKNEIDFTVGKVYEIKNGKLIDDIGDLRPLGDSRQRIDSLDHCFVKDKFIAYIE